MVSVLASSTGSDAAQRSSAPLAQIANVGSDDHPHRGPRVAQGCDGVGHDGYGDHWFQFKLKLTSNILYLEWRFKRRGIAGSRIFGEREVTCVEIFFFCNILTIHTARVLADCATDKSFGCQPSGLGTHALFCLASLLCMVRVSR